MVSRWMGRITADRQRLLIGGWTRIAGLHMLEKPKRPLGGPLRALCDDLWYFAGKGSAPA